MRFDSMGAMPSLFLLVFAVPLVVIAASCKRGDAPPQGPFEIVAEIAPSDRRDVSSSPIAWDEARHRLWIASGDGGSVVRVDPDHPKQLEAAKLGGDLQSLSLSPDGQRVVVVDHSAGRILLLDADTMKVVWTENTGSGAHPRAVIFDPARPRFFYVAMEDSPAVVVYDRATHTRGSSLEVGRLPSGLAASRARDELLVTHRIDPYLDVVDRSRLASVGSIHIADSPHNNDPKVPQGRPFAFASLAWAPDSVTAWIPHQTYAGDKPLKGSFDAVVFPSVSVLDTKARTEMSNEGAGKKHFPGRKELFGAIDVRSGGGDAQIVSGPCAAAIHPNGLRAYVLSCTSNDLMVFDAVNGVATEILKIPGDHPIGIALDRSGSHAYLFADQSKTLTIVDLALGSPIAHPTFVETGAGTAIPLVEVDPVPREMRRALALFYRADSEKTFPVRGREVALGGANWLACASCHLDGFNTTNAFLFEASPRKGIAASMDAIIGHRGLRDFFASAADPDSAQFSPHDVVVALLEMGGLAPDRSGKDRTSEVDANTPEASVVEVARDLSRIVQRDMPLAPSWLIAAPRDKSLPERYSTEAEASWCGGCHKEQYDTWRTSAHAHAAEDPFVAFSAQIEAKRGGESSLRHCFGCHDPNGLRVGAPSLSKGRGVTCTSCHDVQNTIRAGGNADLHSVPRDWNQPHKGAGGLALLRTSEFCAGCHQSFVPGTGLVTIDTLNEWRSSPYAGEHGKKLDKNRTDCVGCHLPALPSGAHDHAALGGNVALAARYPATGWRERLEGNLRTAVSLSVKRDGDSVSVDVNAVGVGHSLPTGVADLRELWLELEGRDASGVSVGRVGAPSPTTGLLDEGAARLGLDLADEASVTLPLHQLGLAARIPFDRRVAAGKSVHFAMPASDLLATKHLSTVRVTLHYRNVRPLFYRSALGGNAALPPDVVIAEATLKP
ncbi:MAG: hypothetical protein NVSMB1_03020 [Polyangiales bacterium]